MIRMWTVWSSVEKVRKAAKKAALYKMVDSMIVGRLPPQEKKSFVRTFLDELKSERRDDST